MQGFAALLLTLALTVCLALPSWAETRINEGTTGTITLNLDTSDTNVTATAYKVIDVKYYNKDSYEAPETRNITGLMTATQLPLVWPTGLRPEVTVPTSGLTTL